MKIKKLSCGQFAGARDFSMEFQDGLNVVYGPNESGKSTLVHLLSRTLFQSAAIDGRKDKDFVSRFFPSRLRDGRIAGDTADGTVVFETERGAFSLSKDWGRGGGARLATPDGILRDPEKIAEVLKRELVYGEGVYAEMLLASQRDAPENLRSLLDAAKKTDGKRELAAAATAAFSQGAGPSAGALGEQIEAKIREIEGSHWDALQGIPARKHGGGRWSVGIGLLHKAYYALEDAKERVEAVEQCRQAGIQAERAYQAAGREYAAAADELESFRRWYAQLAARAEKRKRLDGERREWSRLDAAWEKWPEAEKRSARTQALQTEWQNRLLLDQCAQAEELRCGIARREEELAGCGALDQALVRRAQRLADSVRDGERRLGGLDLLADIALRDGYELEALSAVTGEPLEPRAGGFAIREAAILRVPGVMELRLRQADVDLDGVKRALERDRAALEALLGGYAAGSVEELQEKYETKARCILDLEMLKARLDAALAGLSWEELKAQCQGISGAVREKREIAYDISVLCGTRQIQDCAAEGRAAVKQYREEYGSIERLAARREEMRGRIAALREELDGTADIPEEYLEVGDPDWRLRQLQKEADEASQRREAALADRERAAAALDALAGSLEEDPRDALAGAQRRFSQLSEDLGHWKHIYEVFRQIRRDMEQNPLEGLAERFLENLKVISGGAVSSQLPRRDSLEVSVYSGDRLLDFEKLSEGTKDTVFLAFRLAAVDHLFPHGGGVVVLDDPFTDMDAQRRERSCELVRNFARRHQVIFLTCTEAYGDLLGCQPLHMPSRPGQGGA